MLQESTQMGLQSPRYGQCLPCYGVVMPMGTNRYGPTARYG